MRSLAEWFTRLTDEYKKWADFQFAWQNLRQASIKKLEFPYAYRKGQKELASDVYRTIARRKNLFIQAPTGVGKTISTVFPAVKAVGEGLGDKIFYLTAKTITGTVAKEAFELCAPGVSGEDHPGDGEGKAVPVRGDGLQSCTLSLRERTLRPRERCGVQSVAEGGCFYQGSDLRAGAGVPGLSV